MEGGSIFIRVVDSPDSVSLIIEDQGIGMPKSLLKNVFSSTHSTSRAGTKGEKGTGFGMPIVKKVVECYGAEIQVFSQTVDDNKTNHGTRFVIKFKTELSS